MDYHAMILQQYRAKERFDELDRLIDKLLVKYVQRKNRLARWWISRRIRFARMERDDMEEQMLKLDEIMISHASRAG